MDGLDLAPWVRGRRAGVLLVVGLLLACSADPNYQPPPPPTPDAGFPPEPDRVGAPLMVYSEPVLAQPIELAVELNDGTVLASGPQGLALVATGTVVRLEDGLGTLRAAAPLATGAVLAGDRGLDVLVGEALQPSPLRHALPGIPTALLTVPGRLGLELWLAGDGWLRVWRDGAVVSVLPGALPLTGAQLVFGAAAGGQSAVWVAAGGALYAVVVSEALVSVAYPEALDAPVTHLAVDARRTLWIADDQGQLRSRRADDVWRVHDAVRGVQAVYATPSAPEVWIETSTELWRYDQSEFRQVSNRPTGRALAAASEGSLLYAESAGLVRLYGTRAVRLEGLKEGALLIARTDVRILPVDAASVQAVTSTLDGANLPVLQAPWRVELDPGAIADGAHRLEVSVRYDDNSESQGSLRFSHFEGPLPSWNADIHGLFETRCALCHGERGSARRLDTPELWSQQIDSILLNLRTRRMPLPPSEPLSDAEIGLIEGWQAGGFPLQ